MNGPIYGSLAEVDWAVANAKTQQLECRRCGATEEMPMGLLLVQFADICGGFVKRHADCLPDDLPHSVR